MPDLSGFTKAKSSVLHTRHVFRYHVYASIEHNVAKVITVTTHICMKMRVNYGK